MPTSTAIDFARVADLHWYPNGQSAVSGALLRLVQRLDRLFLRWADELAAQDYHVPTFIPASALARLDYFRSFPHLITFPVALDPAEDNLRRFGANGGLDAQGAVQLTHCAPIHDVLTPAACYHFYLLHQDQALTEARYLTTRATCFRREAYYAPLQRQWSFSMREIVCMGTAEEVKAFLAAFRTRLERFFALIDLPIAWENATDPFFRPAQSAKYLAQKLDPVKTEMIFETGGAKSATAAEDPPTPALTNKLAIGSINFHRNYFGEAFGITRAGREAFTGCVAFGLERWLFAFLTRFGANEANWSTLNLWDA